MIDLHRLGDCRHGGGSDGVESRLFSASGEAPACGQPECRDRPEAEPRPCGSPRPGPGRCLQVGFDRHQQRLVRDRGLRSPTLCAAVMLGVLAGGHGVERGAGHGPRRRRPAAGRWPDPCRARWPHSSPRPPPRAQRAEGLRLGLQQFHLHGQLLRSASWRYPVPPAPDRPWKLLGSEASIPPIAFSRQLLEPEDHLRPTGATEVAPAPTQKPQNDLHACAPPISSAGQVPFRACTILKPGLGKTVSVIEPSLARIYLHRTIKDGELMAQNYRSGIRVRPWTLR